MEIINFEKKEMIPLTHDEQLYHEKRKYYHKCRKKFCNDENEKRKYKIYHKVRDHCHYTGKYRGASHNICNLRYKTQKEIPLVLHNCSTYDLNFIINELAKEFKGNIDCLRENMEKYMTFNVPLKKVNENGKIITCKLKFIDSYRFMSTLLSNLADNLSEINKKECKSCKERENISINCKYINHEDNRLIYKWKKHNNKSYKSIDALKEKFPDIYRFCKKDKNKFLLLLRKGVYPYEYMDSWERLDESELAPQKSFYSELNLEDISDEDYNHTKKVWHTFKINNLDEYHDLYIELDTLQLAEVFESFRNVCINI